MPEPAAVSGGKASPRFGVAGHAVTVRNAPASSRPPASYVPYASMAMTPSDIMHQEMCYQGKPMPKRQVDWSLAQPEFLIGVVVAY